MYGLVIAICGAALCVLLSGTGSAIGVSLAARAGAGVASEKPELFGKLVVLEALPATQGIYGFLIAIIVMLKINMFGGLVEPTISQGWALLFATLPCGLVGLTSGIMQGKAAASSIHMVARQPDSLAKGITMTAVVETYAILALLVSFLLIQFGVTVG